MPRMTEERLAEIRRRREFRPGVELGDVVDELLAEVDALRADLAILRADDGSAERDVRMLAADVRSRELEAECNEWEAVSRRMEAELSRLRTQVEAMRSAGLKVLANWDARLWGHVRDFYPGMQELRSAVIEADRVLGGERERG
ncbi:MAG TPA: hypothetical protein VFT22_31135 [Kofleriaceae bacterium]|nr:hypothetical protein [Kofleriaceae bacterium]